MGSLNIDLDPSKSPRRIRDKARRDEFDKLLSQYPSIASNADELNQLRSHYIATGELPTELKVPGSRVDSGPKLDVPNPSGSTPITQFPDTEVTPPSAKPVPLVPRTWETPASVGVDGKLNVLGEAGNYARFGNAANPGQIPITDKQLLALISGSPEDKAKVYPNGIPPAHERIAVQYMKERGVQRRKEQTIAQADEQSAAKAGMATNKVASQIDEGLAYIKELQTTHADLVDKGYFGNPAAAFFTKGEAYFTGAQGNQDLAKAKGFRDAKRGLIARLKRITGDNGILTEVDADRLEGLLASEAEGKESAQFKTDTIIYILKLAKNNEHKNLARFLETIGYKTQQAPIDDPNYVPGQNASGGGGNVDDEVGTFLSDEGIQ